MVGAHLSNHDALCFGERGDLGRATRVGAPSPRETCFRRSQAEGPRSEPKANGVHQVKLAFAVQ